MEFTEENIIKLFGNEAAENEDVDALKKYYFKGATYNQLKSSNPFYIIVGHKGTGKSALLKILSSEDNEAGEFAVILQQDDVFTSNLSNDFTDIIKQCRENIINTVFKKLIEEIRLRNSSKTDIAFSAWLAKFSQTLKDLLGLSYADIKNNPNQISYEDFCLLSKTPIIKEKPITVYLDDIDLGWTNKESERHNISALINAIRLINRNTQNIKFRIAMRSSVYYSVRTSDESTDKFESSVIWLAWSNDEIFNILIKRVISFENKDYEKLNFESQRQVQLAKYLSDIFESHFQGKGHWENAPIHRVLMSLVRKRPRDLIKLCILAARKAAKYGHKKINTKDLEETFVDYSNGRLQDTVNEYSSELINLNEILLKMKPSAKEVRACIYKTDALMMKMKNIIDQVSNKTFANGVKITPKNLATFLYKINFMTARKETPEGIQRLYFEEQKYAINEFTDFGYDLEIHPAYRWALQPRDVSSLYSQIDLSI